MNTTPLHAPLFLPATMRGMEVINGALALNPALSLPQPAAGELLIRVAYTALNRADVLQVAGKYPAPEGASPLPGLEVSGWVAALGEAVRGWDIGAPCCALLSGGGYAEYVTVPATQVAPIPASLTLAEAAALPEAVATSVMALIDEAALKPGERVLMHGGTSGLGLILIQIARALGAEVFTTVGSDEKIRFLEPFGVTALNHHTEPFAERILARTGNEGIDVIIDTLGGPQVLAHFGLLRRGGRMVSLAMMEGHMLDGQSMRRLLTHHLRWSGATLRSRGTEEKATLMAYAVQHLWPHIAAGHIRPAIDRSFALEDAEKALAHMQKRLHLGKILLEVAPN